MAAATSQQPRLLRGDFMEDIAGRHIVSDNLGSAKYWKDANGVPMPDRSHGVLLFLSIIGGIFGLDHLYLRSPVTGLIKLITLGGFGIWWLWDWLQIWLEKERVLKYGLTAPFDIPASTFTGVGQGMITDKASGYSALASFPLFMFATIFGFVGLDNILAGQPGIAIRRLVDTIVCGAWVHASNSTSSTVGRAFLTFFAIIAGFFVVVPWLGNLIGLVTGYASGVSYFNTGTILNWFMNVYDKPFKDNDKEVHSKISLILRDQFGFADRQREDILKPFQINDISPITGTAEQKVGPWIPAMLWGNPTGALVFSILNAIPGPRTLVQSWVRASLLDEDLLTAGLQSMTNAIPGAGAAMAIASQTQEQIAARQKQLEAVKAAAAQSGGGHSEPLSYEAKILGATIGALVVGGGIKGLVDYLMG